MKEKNNWRVCCFDRGWGWIFQRYALCMPLRPLSWRKKSEYFDTNEAGGCNQDIKV